MVFEGVVGFGNQDGATRTFASARDIGNVAAGFVAGFNGFTWEGARVGFDALESYQKKGFASEGKPTQRAQMVGFIVGAKIFKEK